jgi:hypothetical protein
MPIKQPTYAVPREDLGVAFHEFNPANEGFVATQALPIFPATKKASTISVVKRTNLKRADAKHANGAAFNRVNLETADLAFACADWGLEIQLTDTDRENYANDFDAEIESTQTLVKKLYIEQEIRAATLLFNTSTWTGSGLYHDWSAAPWDAAASAVLAHVASARNSVRANTGVEPDSMLIGPVTFNNLLLNTDIKAKFPGATVITDEMFRANVGAILGIKNLLVGKAVYDSAAEGQVFSGSDIWSDDYALVFKMQTGATKANAGLGRTILWTPVTPENATIDVYREDQTKSDIIRANQFGVEKVFDEYFGFLMKVDA